MRYRRLGTAGPLISEVSVGTYLQPTGGADAASFERCLARAFDLGVTFFDTADSYPGAEEVLGRVVRQIGRDRVVVATKCFYPTGPAPTDRGLSRAHVRAAVHASLVRLGIDDVDLLQCHRYDPEAPLAETVAALGELIREGKIRGWGVSRFAAAQLREACDEARRQNVPPPLSTQEPYHLLKRDGEDAVFPTCRELGVSVIAYAPLAQGVLTGKYDAGGADRRGDGPHRATMYHLGPEDRARAARVASVARELGWTAAQLALAWVLRRREIATALCGASRAAQIEDNILASGRVLDAAVCETLENPDAHL